ncbi:hypothetical protein TVAG_140940 [Trichomonas vaginalis G3]|uniref:Uncharacterized protein n=1 Tax=Trichomonas vaginalis (strain ATCC PRA-98 / G3) TaxID=412133 RepID=A2FER8_TRIV3|nr:hypothetical protein TVAGG3_0603850 [Trichomonas vaginalis G3]EAX96605.1 hypothetical protein TVAG_140940 [Trichomonas vaginalis G3]KAI5524104.1 hypothetical protein TVAGG3_0603850 [Trichomonas vaginalis G3]|eukprot:XP_001309535.1 hypothetical protein [Trichomonas vaginalis G3]
MSTSASEELKSEISYDEEESSAIDVKKILESLNISYEEEEEEKSEILNIQDTLNTENQKNSNAEVKKQEKPHEKTYFAHRYETGITKTPKRRKFKPIKPRNESQSLSAPNSPNPRRLSIHEKPSLPPKQDPVQHENHNYAVISNESFMRLNKGYKSNIRPKRFSVDDYIPEPPLRIVEKIPKCYRDTEERYERNGQETRNRYAPEVPTIDSYLQKDFKPSYHTKAEKIKEEYTRQKILKQQRAEMVEKLNQDMRKASMEEAKMKMKNRPSRPRPIDNPEKKLRDLRTNMRNNYESYMNFVNGMKDNISKRQCLLERLENQFMANQQISDDEE